MVPPPELKKIGEVQWELPTSYKEGMLVPGVIFGTDSIVKEMDDRVFDQLANVCCLPGIVKNGYCMPDGHSGYGFPIGGVAAFDPEEGIISPGGIGFASNFKIFCASRCCINPKRIAALTILELNE